MGLDWPFTLLSFPHISIIADIYVGIVPRTSGTCRNQRENNTELAGGLLKVAAGLRALKYIARQQVSKPNGCFNQLGRSLSIARHWGHTNTKAGKLFFRRATDVRGSLDSMPPNES